MNEIIYRNVTIFQRFFGQNPIFSVNGNSQEVVHTISERLKKNLKPYHKKKHNLDFAMNNQYVIHLCVHSLNSSKSIT